MSDDRTEDKDDEKDYHEQDAVNDDDKGFAPAKKNISYLPQDFSIRELRLMVSANELNLQPDWQRNFVYDRKKASKLIESILMDVPIPALYFAQEATGHYSVIDGQQRLTSFISFLDGRFPRQDKMFEDFTLTGLEIRTDLNGKNFNGIDAETQFKINTTSLHTIIIKKESDEDVRFDVFERLNTGSIKLNEDELRNSVYHGNYINLLEELAKYDHFKKLVRKPTFENRLIYRGMILRFLALSSKPIEAYKPSMKKYCNTELRENRYLSEDKAKEYSGRFYKSVDLCFTTFGENAFRRFKPGTESDHNGRWVTSRINLAMFDVQMCGFAYLDKSQVSGRTDAIREAAMHLMSYDEDFIYSIEMQTSNTSTVRLRFKKWKEMLDTIISGSPQPRNFPYEVKKQLFQKDPACKICGNQILLIEDAEIDHIKPFSDGGTTTIENAQLAHRYCNRHKSNN